MFFSPMQDTLLEASKNLARKAHIKFLNLRKQSPSFVSIGWEESMGGVGGVPPPPPESVSCTSISIHCWWGRRTLTLSGSDGKQIDANLVVVAAGMGATLTLSLFAVDNNVGYVDQGGWRLTKNDGRSMMRCDRQRCGPSPTNPLVGRDMRQWSWAVKDNVNVRGEERDVNICSDSKAVRGTTWCEGWRWWWENVNITIRHESACNSDDDDDHLIILPSLSLAAAWILSFIFVDWVQVLSSSNGLLRRLRGERTLSARSGIWGSVHPSAYLLCPSYRSTTD
jgi:hypothetical protein